MSNLEGGYPESTGKDMALGSSHEDILEGSSQQKLSILRPGEFEKMHMSPAHKVDGNLRSVFGNPTPL